MRFLCPEELKTLWQRKLAALQEGGQLGLIHVFLPLPASPACVHRSQALTEGQRFPRSCMATPGGPTSLGSNGDLNRGSNHKSRDVDLRFEPPKTDLGNSCDLGSAISNRLRDLRFGALRARHMQGLVAHCSATRFSLTVTLRCSAPLSERRFTCDTSPFSQECWCETLVNESVTRQPYDTEKLAETACDIVMLCLSLRHKLRSGWVTKMQRVPVQFGFGSAHGRFECIWFSVRMLLPRKGFLSTIL